MSISLKSIFFPIIVFLIVIGAGGCNGNFSDSNNNTSDTPELMINEIVAKNSNGSADWIEFYAAGDIAVTLSDYYLTDDNGYSERASLPNVTLAPGEFIVIQAVDAAPEDGSYFVPFKLGGDDILTLYKGNMIIDTLEWEVGDAPEEWSFGRFPDGSEEVITMTPTPGEENEFG